ncbi:MAG: helix-turn-helix domain-containing protein [Dechloromonas sp.]|nr:MAG: helix-turn-helix domain-containing protein [Dechloromonas sp.]
MPTNPHYIDVAALQSRWDLHPESVRRIIRSGHLPAIRFGGRLRINLEDVNAFEASHRVNPATYQR